MTPKVRKGEPPVWFVVIRMLQKKILKVACAIVCVLLESYITKNAAIENPFLCCWRRSYRLFKDTRCSAKSLRKKSDHPGFFVRTGTGIGHWWQDVAWRGDDSLIVFDSW